MMQTNTLNISEKRRYSREVCVCDKKKTKEEKIYIYIITYTKQQMNKSVFVCFLSLSRQKKKRSEYIIVLRVSCKNAYLVRTPTKIINNKTVRPIPRRINLNFKPRCLCSTALAKCLFPCSS